MEDIILSYYSVNPGAWVSIGIVFLSVFISWALNFSAHKVRVFGTLLDSFGCFIIATWFFIFVMNLVFENPKPNQTPLDLQTNFTMDTTITAFLTGFSFCLLLTIKEK